MVQGGISANDKKSHPTSHHIHIPTHKEKNYVKELTRENKYTSS